MYSNDEARAKLRQDRFGGWALLEAINEAGWWHSQLVALLGRFGTSQAPPTTSRRANGPTDLWL